MKQGKWTETIITRAPDRSHSKVALNRVRVVIQVGPWCGQVYVRCETTGCLCVGKSRRFLRAPSARLQAQQAPPNRNRTTPRTTHEEVISESSSLHMRIVLKLATRRFHHALHCRHFKQIYHPLLSCIVFLSPQARRFSESIALQADHRRDRDKTIYRQHTSMCIM